MYGWVRLDRLVFHGSRKRRNGMILLCTCLCRHRSPLSRIAFAHLDLVGGRRSLQSCSTKEEISVWKLFSCKRYQFDLCMKRVLLIMSTNKRFELQKDPQPSLKSNDEYRFLASPPLLLKISMTENVPMSHGHYRISMVPNAVLQQFLFNEYP